MAGAFGYEKEHYDLSMKVGELVLFPAVRQTSDNIEIAAPGTSCRHHINHGTGRNVKHPIEIFCCYLAMFISMFCNPYPKLRDVVFEVGPYSFQQ